MSVHDFVSAAQSIIERRAVLCVADGRAVFDESELGKPVYVLVVDVDAPQFLALVRCDERSSDVFPLYVGGLRSEGRTLTLDRSTPAVLLDLVEFIELVEAFRDAGFPDDETRLSPVGDPSSLEFLAGVVRAATTGEGVSNFVFGGGSFGPSSSEPN